MYHNDEFIEILELHKGILYKVANSYCKDPEDRKDLVQETILQLWRAYGNYNPDFKFSTWMYRIALNVAISFYRKNIIRKTSASPITDQIINFPVLDDGQEEDINLQLLHQFIQELRALDKALMLLFLEEKSHREIAEILGITESNVGTKMSRIKAGLSKKFLTIKYQ